MALAKLKTTPLRDPAEIARDLPALHAHPECARVEAEHAAIMARIEKAKHRRKVAMARGRGQQPTRSILERARHLVTGGTIVTTPPALEADAAVEELDLLNRARIAKCEEFAAVKGKLDFEAELRFAALRAEAKRAVLQDTTRLYENLSVDRTIDAILLTKGYTPHTAACPRHDFPEAARLGDPDRAGTPANRFKTWLRDVGII